MATNGKKSKKRIIIVSVIAFVLIGLALVVFLGSKKDPILAVQVEKVQRRTITQVVTATGKIQPEVQVQISPEVSGEIVSLPVKEGDRVKKGDILLKIKPDVYVAQRDQYSAMLQQAKAGLSKSEPDFRRIESLFKKGLASESDFDQVRSAYEASTARVVRARLSGAVAQLGARGGSENPLPKPVSLPERFR